MSDVRIDGVLLAYVEAGAGRPVVLIHGWATDHHVFDAIMAALSASHHVVAVDLRGYGASDAPEQSYSISGLANDVAAIIAHLGLDPPVLVGHSMGGVVAVDLAARLPVSALVILESPVVPPAQMLAGIEPVLAAVRGPEHKQVVAGFMDRLAGPHYDERARAALVEGALGCAKHVLVSTLEALWSFDSVAAVQRITCPVLYVRTDAEYTDLPRLCALCPQTQVAHLKGCGHYFPLEVPEQVVPMITGFLQTV